MVAAAQMEPNDTIRLNSTTMMNISRLRRATFQSRMSIMPRVVSTPLPPRKPKYRGNRCPMMQKKPARYCPTSRRFSSSIKGAR